MSVRLEIAEVVVSRGPITNQFLDWMRSTERPILGGLARMAGVFFFVCVLDSRGLRQVCSVDDGAVLSVRLISWL